MPYKSTSLALQDVIAGHVDILCDQTTNAFPQLASQTVKAYAITSPKRNARFPDIPTTAELGLPQVDVEVQHHLYAPKGTLEAALDALNAALRVALDDPAVQKKLVDMGTDLFAPEQRSRAAHAKKLADDLVKLRAVGREGKDQRQLIGRNTRKDRTIVRRGDRLVAFHLTVRT